MNIQAKAPRHSVCHDNPHAMDIDVIVTIGDKVFEGELTLLPRREDGLYDSWGNPDNWIDSNLLSAFRSMDDETFTTLCRHLALVAGRVCDNSVYLQSTDPLTIDAIVIS